MNIALSKILSHVYELEGLLLVADRHGSDTPAVVYDRIREHAAALHELSQQMPDRSQQPSTPEPEPAPVCEPEPVPEPAPELVPAPEPVPVPVPEPEPTPVPEPEPVSVPEPEPVPVALTDDDDVPPRTDDDVPRPAFTFATPADTVMPTLDGDEPTQALRVDEKLQRSMSKDLRKAFSINDRFRFRRELFEGSEAEFVDAINMIEAMHSYDEARDYFLGDLGWDEDVPEVSEFMTIVRNHFA